MLCTRASPEALRLAEAETLGSKELVATLDVAIGTVKAGRREHPAHTTRLSQPSPLAVVSLSDPSIRCHKRPL